MYYLVIMIHVIFAKIEAAGLKTLIFATLFVIYN
jgi:hypothetical protein